MLRGGGVKEVSLILQRIVRVGTTFITSLGINIQSICHGKTNSSLNIFFCFFHICEYSIFFFKLLFAFFLSMNLMSSSRSH